MWVIGGGRKRGEGEREKKVGEKWREKVGRFGERVKREGKTSPYQLCSWPPPCLQS